MHVFFLAPDFKLAVDTGGVGARDVDLAEMMISAVLHH